MEPATETMQFRPASMTIQNRALSKMAFLGLHSDVNEWIEISYFSSSDWQPFN